MSNNTQRALLLTATVSLAALAMAACGGFDEQYDDDNAPAMGSSSGSSSGSGGNGTSSSTSSGTGAGDPTSTSSGGTPGSGTLTAGDWDDNLNWDFYDAYRQDYDDLRSIQVDDRIVIEVVDDNGDPISGAIVSVDGNGTHLSAPTGSNGRLLFFPAHDGAPQSGLTVTVQPPSDQLNAQPVTIAAPTGNSWEIVLPGSQQIAPPSLDLAFVLDATGSMGDEIAYVRAEIDDIAQKVEDNFSNIDMRFAVVAYRDGGKANEIEAYDFTGDLQQFRANLNQISAFGGGDYPEAMEHGLQEMNQLSWRPGNVARVSFLVADAPPHEADAQEMLAQADSARKAGIKIYPVAASGADENTEWYMRQAAQLTFARYIFLTDDSGVGGEHGEPHIPCYQVQYLNNLMSRMIASELSGSRVPADPQNVLRTVGNPNEYGICKLSDDSEVGF